MLAMHSWVTISFKIIRLIMNVLASYVFTYLSFQLLDMTIITPQQQERLNV